MKKLLVQPNRVGLIQSHLKYYFCLNTASYSIYLFMFTYKAYFGIPEKNFLYLYMFL